VEHNVGHAFNGQDLLASVTPAAPSASMRPFFPTSQPNLHSWQKLEEAQPKRKPHRTRLWKSRFIGTMYHLSYRLTETYLTCTVFEGDTGLGWNETSSIHLYGSPRWDHSHHVSSSFASHLTSRPSRLRPNKTTVIRLDFGKRPQRHVRLCGPGLEGGMVKAEHLNAMNMPTTTMVSVAAEPGCAPMLVSATPAYLAYDA